MQRQKKIGTGAIDKVAKAQSGITDVLTEAALIYNKLEEAGGIANVDKGSLDNIIAKMRSSEYIGQPLGSLVGTQEQSWRQTIKNIRPVLINDIRQASEMGARGLDSEKELEFYLSAASDPSKDIQSNIAALIIVDEKYGKGNLAETLRSNPNFNQDLMSGMLSQGEQIRAEDLATGTSKVKATPEQENLRKKYDY